MPVTRQLARESPAAAAMSASFDVDVLRLRRFLHTGGDAGRNSYCSPDDVATDMICFREEEEEHYRITSIFLYFLV